MTACGWQVIFTGTQPELEMVENIRVAMAASSCSLAGCLSVEEMAALVSLAPIVIASNSGPVHIAAAVGTPVVDLYALTNPQHTPGEFPIASSRTMCPASTATKVSARKVITTACV